MCNDPLFRLRQNEDFINEMLSQPITSYSQYKRREEDTKLFYLIRDKYLKLLGNFIEVTYPGLRFDVHMRNRNPKESKAQWYGYTYMELIILDVIIKPIYNPMTFEPVYRTATYDGHLSMDTIYDDIDSFIPEINKHLMITFIPYHSPDQMNYMSGISDIPSFECWDKYWRYTKMDNYNKIQW
jgi:hypothetical protein